jgi:hypothetical protein
MTEVVSNLSFLSNYLGKVGYLLGIPSGHTKIVNTKDLRPPEIVVESFAHGIWPCLIERCQILN